MKRTPINPAQRALARKLLRHQREYNEVLELMRASGLEACAELPDGELRTLEPSTNTLRFRLSAQLIDPSWYDGEPAESFPDGLEDGNYPPMYPYKNPIQ